MAWDTLPRLARQKWPSACQKWDVGGENMANREIAPKKRNTSWVTRQQERYPSVSGTSVNTPVKNAAKGKGVRIRQLPTTARNGRRSVQSGNDPLFAVYAAAESHVGFSPKASRSSRSSRSSTETHQAAGGRVSASQPSDEPFDAQQLFHGLGLYDVRFGRDKETIGTCS